MCDLESSKKVDMSHNLIITLTTKEKAEEYILLNKPCLSINEITNLTETNPSDWLNKELIKLVKSKI